MGSKGSKGTAEPTGALERRATRTARRLTNLAMDGFPPLDQLKARSAKFFARVEKKLDAVPPERRQQPPATIALPAALQYVLLGEGDEVAVLRAMFENLLAAAMDRDTASSTHPAFVSMISQLTPDEARILKSIDRDEYVFVTVFESLTNRVLRRRTRLGIGAGSDESRQLQYISNLVRLGILRISPHGPRDQTEWDAVMDELTREFPSCDPISSAQLMEVTPLGRQFLETCVRPRLR